MALFEKFKWSAVGDAGEAPKPSAVKALTPTPPTPPLPAPRPRQPLPMSHADLADAIKDIPPTAPRRDHANELAEDMGYDDDVEMWRVYFGSWLCRLDGRNKHVDGDTAFELSLHATSLMHCGRSKDEALNEAAIVMGFRSFSAFKSCLISTLIQNKFATLH